MIRVVSAEKTTIACPTQIEGTTDDGRAVYARYRGGRCRVYVGHHISDLPVESAIVFSKEVGDPLDGHMDGAELAALTAGLIEWPANIVSDGETKS